MSRLYHHDGPPLIMPTTLSPQDFVAKWRKADLKERSSVQERFIDLCRLVGHPTPAENDPTGGRFAFEAGVSKTRGSLSDHPVFGSWPERNIDALVYQEELRGEW